MRLSIRIYSIRLKSLRANHRSLSKEFEEEFFTSKFLQDFVSVFTVAVQLITSSSALEFWRLRMLGELITRYLVLLFGYAFPAFECFRSVEKNKVDVEEIKFWCQYWIIIALVTVCERIGDAFLSWLPMYGEVKLAFFIYLWYPKTKGTGYVYESMLRPFVTRHETDIERKLQEMKTRASQGSFPDSKTKKSNGHEPSAPLLPVPSPNDFPSMNKHKSKNTGWLSRPPPPPGSSTINRAFAGSSNSKRAQVQLDEETEYFTTMDTDNSSVNQKRTWLRRTKPNQR
ncbi:HVA22-LIKE PROTEIN [Salix koriyanagi]|uniref:HVA22-like protein n=1 Tax=Salix koriyanagi TaxID=2511006 RepID=A0A9Q1APH3_9ROSI|nr:HVA22-LIKE PROTEIN [Salix koriyanagi]